MRRIPLKEFTLLQWSLLAPSVSCLGLEAAAWMQLPYARASASMLAAASPGLFMAAFFFSMPNIAFQMMKLGAGPRARAWFCLCFLMQAALATTELVF